MVATPTASQTVLGYDRTINKAQSQTYAMRSCAMRRLGKDVFRHVADVDFYGAATVELESEVKSKEY